MAIDAKMSFMKTVEQRCADRLTVENMNGLMGILSDVLQGFRMEELDRDGWQMTEDDMLRAFVNSMKVQGRSEKTIRHYSQIIGRFMGFAKAPTRQITVYHVRDWITAEKERGLQASSLDGERQVLSSYFGWLWREALIERNPVANVGRIKIPKKRRSTYTDVDMAKLDRCCETIRDRAILHFLRATGCRISEMTGLDRDQVDLDAMECVVHGKGDKERMVYFDAVTAMILQEYLQSRTDEEPALFVGQRGGRLQPSGARWMLKHLGERAGVDHVHPHKFRRTMATEMARTGMMQIQEISALLGHTKLDTSMKYVNVDSEDIKYKYRRTVG